MPVFPYGRRVQDRAETDVKGLEKQVKKSGKTSEKRSEKTDVKNMKKLLTHPTGCAIVIQNAAEDSRCRKA